MYLGEVIGEVGRWLLTKGWRKELRLSDKAAD